MRQGLRWTWQRKLNHYRRHTKPDERDSGRDVAPLEAADDAITIDTTALDADAAFVAELALIAKKRG